MHSPRPVPRVDVSAAARSAVATVGLLAATLAGCGGDDTARSDPQVVSVDVARVAADPGAALDAAGSATMSGADLYALLGDDTNLVLSPYSVAVALAMTRAGAAGTTGSEMDAVLHATQIADLHRAYGSLDAVLAERTGTYEIAGDDPVELELSFGNAIWPQAGFPFEQPFLERLAEHYGSGLQTVDYVEATEDARDTINGWVADRTRDRIPELIPAGVLSALTRLVLTNAIYLNAPWRLPFEPEATTDAPFHRLDGTTVTAPLMHVSGEVAYGAGDGWQAVRLPYAGEDLAMVVLVPEPGGFEAALGRLDPDLIAAVDGALAERMVELDLPSFRFRSQIDLEDPLRELGMPTAFSDSADFSAMSPEPLAITDVLHEAFIAVDEEGTEAAAATAVIVAETAAPVDEPVRLTVDRPFLFWIVDQPTGAVLFLGQVVDPTVN